MQATNYANPSDGKPNPYQFAFRTEMNMFEYMHAHPPLGMQFDNHMSGYRQGRPSWMDHDSYPVEEQLFQAMDTSPEAVLLVDVGGGQGHDLAEFLYVSRGVALKPTVTGIYCSNPSTRICWVTVPFWSV
jgi:hypothetical protein